MPDVRAQIRTPAAVYACAYGIGDIVYLRIAEERRRGMVTGLAVKPGGLAYQVTWPSGQEDPHYEIELTTEYLPDYGQ